MFKPTKIIITILLGLFGWNYFFGTIEIWPYSLWYTHFPLLSPTTAPSYSILITVDVIWQYFLACLFAYYVDFLLTKTKWFTGILFLSFAALSYADLMLTIGFANFGGGNSPLENFTSKLAGTLFVYIVLLSFIALAVLIVKFFKNKEVSA